MKRLPKRQATGTTSSIIALQEARLGRWPPVNGMPRLVATLDEQLAESPPLERAFQHYLEALGHARQAG